MGSLTVYHVPGWRSFRPIWLCHELGVAVEVERIDPSPAFRDSAAWRAISPAGKVPAARDGGLVLFESGAIVEYILDRYGEGRLRPPAGSDERALHQQWCWFAEATLIRPLGLAGSLRAAAAGSVADDARRKVTDALAVVAAAVAERPFLMGEAFTAADVMTGYSLLLLRNFGVLDARSADAAAYLERLEARDAFQRALEA